jgi:hypothetical protein
MMRRAYGFCRRLATDSRRQLRNVWAGSARAAPSAGSRRTPARSLLVATHGAGRLVCTGLAFFRQLPAGVPGAFRLAANLLARESPAPAPTTLPIRTI